MSGNIPFRMCIRMNKSLTIIIMGLVMIIIMVYIVDF